MSREINHTLQTKRLILRPFTIDDAEAVYDFVKHIEIADNTCQIPHPYTLEMAKQWMSEVCAMYDKDQYFVFAIVLKKTKQLIGAIGFTGIDYQSFEATIGYWIGMPFWNSGYATEATQKIIEYGFDAFQLQTFTAEVFSHNEASSKVLQKVGMKYFDTYSKFVPLRNREVTFKCYKITQAVGKSI